MSQETSLANEFMPLDALNAIEIIDDDQSYLVPIPGTRDFRINSKKDQDYKPWFDERDPRFIHCVRPSKCEKLKNNTCFGSKLPYSLTSLDLTDSFSQNESREKLYNYEALRNIPKCWAVIQVSPDRKGISLLWAFTLLHFPAFSLCRFRSEVRANQQSRHGLFAIAGNVSHHRRAVSNFVQHDLLPEVPQVR